MEQEQNNEQTKKVVIDDKNAEDVFLNLRTYFTNKLLLGEFEVYSIDNNMVHLRINNIHFQLGVDYYRGEMNLDMPFFDGKFFDYLDNKESKQVFDNITKFGLAKAISDKEIMIKRIQEELLIMKSKL